MPLEIEGKIYLNTKEAAKKVDRSENTLKVKAKDWKWRKYKVGRKTYYDLQEVEKWLANNLRQE